MANILSLPTELTIMVALQLVSVDFFYFRQASKEINNRTLSIFTQRYFSTRRIMIERRSLENLVDISRHPTFGPAVRTLQVCIDHLLEPNLLSNQEGTDTQAYAALLQGQKILREVGLDVEYLTEAMIGLVNCKKLIFGDRGRPWGAAHILRETGYYPGRLVETWMFDSVDFIQRAIHISLLSAADSHLPLEEVRISFGHEREDCDRVNPHMLVLPAFDALRVRSCLTSVTCLRVWLSCNYETTIYQGSWETNFVHFVLLFLSLSHLEIDLGGDYEYGRFPRLCEILYVPTLEVLELNTVFCTESELTKLLLSHKATLKEVALTSISIIEGGGDWPSLLRTIRDSLALDYFQLSTCLVSDTYIFRDDETRRVEHAEDWQVLIDSISEALGI